jgi:hypothetical protein
MTTLTEGMHAGEFIGQLAMGPGYHIDAITLTSGEDLDAGALLSKVETGTPTLTVGTPFSGTAATVGNGAISDATADAGAKAGTWQLVCTSTGATGEFTIYDPDGIIVGVLTIGTPYNGTGTINITVADGANDWLVGDVIPITVAYDGDDVTPKYVEYDATLPLSGILVPNTDATGGDTATTALVRGPAIVNSNDLTWFSGATAAQILAGKAALLALGIKAA